MTNRNDQMLHLTSQNDDSGEKLKYRGLNESKYGEENYHVSFAKNDAVLHPRRVHAGDAEEKGISLFGNVFNRDAFHAHADYGTGFGSVDDWLGLRKLNQMAAFDTGSTEGQRHVGPQTADL